MYAVTYVNSGVFHLALCRFVCGDLNFRYGLVGSKVEPCCRLVWLQQHHDHAGSTVGLREHRHARLMQDFGLRERGGGHGIVGVQNLASTCPGFNGSRCHAVDRVGKPIVGCAKLSP